jgi:hypothetical protein
MVTGCALFISNIPRLLFFELGMIVYKLEELNQSKVELEIRLHTRQERRVAAGGAPAEFQQE